MRDNVRDTAITVTTRKYDGGIHRQWTARLLLVDDDLILTYTPPGTTLVHHTRDCRSCRHTPAQAPSRTSAGGRRYATSSWAAHSADVFLISRGSISRSSAV